MIGNFIQSKKKYTFGVQKGENKPSGCFKVSEHGVWAPKSVWSCDISIDLKFYMNQDFKIKYSFNGQKGENKPNPNMDRRPIIYENIHRSEFFL
jgi:hypothetical protein